MAQYDGMKFTKAGRTLLAKALAGAELHFTRVAAGDGTLPEGADVYERTDLVHPVRDLPISSVKATTVGQATITAALSNEGLAMGFFAREIGIFAADPDDGEILYAYTNARDYPDYIPGQDGADVIRSMISFVTVIDSAQNVTAVISGDLVYVTRDELDDRVSQIETGIAALFGPPAPVSAFWTRTQGDGNRLRPVTLEDARTAIMGVRDIESLNRRLEVAEDNLGEIVLVLDGNNIYPGYSHMLLENFSPPDQIDSYSCDVLSVVAGDDSLDCSPVAGMITGSMYTLTDGINFELVQAKSVSIENGIQRVILTAPVENTYRLASCRLYRTSALIEGGKAGGPATPRS
ncbi:MAG: phage tail protein, partial [Synergistaceae bacterium]|nr:phage tail protein [Synergistaceae bacterium]